MAGHINNPRKKGRPLAITEIGSHEGITFSTEAYDKNKETARVIQSIDAGIKDANEGRLYTIAKARHILKKYLHKKT